MGQFKILEINNPQNTHSDLTIIDFINNETEYFINNNIQKIAQKCYVSTASISRFANKNGFQTFRKLQQYVHEKNEWQKKHYRLSTGTQLQDSINNITTYNIYAINETVQNIQHQQLEVLVNDIIQANRILIFGVGSSWIACEELANNLQKIGVNIACNKDFHTQLLTIPGLTANDQIILFSKSGRTREILEILKIAFNYKIPVTLITSNLNCGYEKYLHNKILFRTLKQISRYSAVSSKIIQLLFVDIVFNQIIEKNSDYKNYIINGTKIVKSWNSAK
ncbi:hypothetical protein P344_06195 [Spiroplasma mirum ATCC 29335]|uniref:HTH rpiR-type domain-containing protein n=1 Tax=Spiroplasma mirum ATCC 29335 TaxID=838561 RepID=W0GRZ4_9MOLU|nr:MULTISPECIES: MurR/RpiR family transcriptional regulator [Spiroplasma]AHF61414.1 hypothetical protein SMM_1040 [Spiroplasma mirum ATCC 29335]AHI58546.1 hypothetical protein P344_06195 [Spiroplasma mirum ATCC 29335]AKM53464.1 RpiR family transcriptional regulator [Spiroplasma atrichopogonis]